MTNNAATARSADAPSKQLIASPDQIRYLRDLVIADRVNRRAVTGLEWPGGVEEQGDLLDSLEVLTK